ncbi:MAG: DsbA family protein [Proteobacteria bacterium]|jgi:protein-disulfide isomerase|nr:DsbA family protein [Pseudomonadota bacterium]
MARADNSTRSDNTNSNGSSNYSVKFLVALLTISILTNMVLMVRLRMPDVWENLQFVFIKPLATQNNEHIRGNNNSEITVIEYSDFQCPFCRGFHQTLKNLVRERDVRWVYRHFPLETIHPLANRAAQASECASDQDRFWEYADLLFETQNPFGEAEFLNLAISARLNLDQFAECLGNDKYAGYVLEQIDEGNRLKISGTPTYFINGERHTGLAEYDQLLQQIPTN